MFIERGMEACIYVWVCVCVYYYVCIWSIFQLLGFRTLILIQMERDMRSVIAPLTPSLELDANRCGPHKNKTKKALKDFSFLGNFLLFWNFSLSHTLPILILCIFSFVFHANDYFIQFAICCIPPMIFLCEIFKYLSLCFGLFWVYNLFVLWCVNYWLLLIFVSFHIALTTKTHDVCLSPFLSSLAIFVRWTVLELCNSYAFRTDDR